MSSVGIAGWSFPRLSIIDLLGLNDHVIARAGAAAGERMMAHEKDPPPGYLECFSPRLVEAREPVDLAPERIVECETRFWSGPPPPLR
jgi:arabinofuranosyltransferase